ncbi:MAG: hypothetical protein U0625_11320 [Phycisphaerales bacterium]
MEGDRGGAGGVNTARLQRAFVWLRLLAKVGSAVCAIALVVLISEKAGPFGIRRSTIEPVARVGSAALVPMLLLWGVAIVGATGRLGRWMAALVVALAVIGGGVATLPLVAAALPVEIYDTVSGFLIGGCVLLGLNLLLARIFLRPAANRRLLVAQWIAAAVVAPPFAAIAVQCFASSAGLWTLADSLPFVELAILWTAGMGIFGVIVLRQLARGTRETYDTTAFQLDPVPEDLADHARFTARCPGCMHEAEWTAGVPCACAECHETVGYEIGHYRCTCGYNLRGVSMGACTECGRESGGPITGIACPWCRGATVRHQGRCACPACAVAFESRVLKRVRKSSNPR